MENLSRLDLSDLKNHSEPYLDTIFSQANGHFGVRASNPLTPDATSGTLVNGFYETNPITYGESAVGYAKNHQTIANLPDLRVIKVKTAGEKIFTRSNLIDSSLDFDTGVLNQTYQLSTDDNLTVKLVLTTIIAQKDQNLFGLNYEFSAGSYDGAIKVSKPLHLNINLDNSNDPRKARQINDLQTQLIHHTDCQKDISIRAQHSKLSLTMALEAVQGSLQDWELNLSNGPAVASYLAKVSNVTGFTNQSQMLFDHQTFQFVLNDAKEYWQEVWNNSRISIDGDAELTQAIRYNIFQLNQSAGRNGRTNIAAKGLSGTGYEGHYFWDTEMYLLPYFTYTNPKVAEKLLDFRYNTLDMARKQARTLGVSKGALFPWRTINGEEASAYYPAGTAQYHIDGDIAYAVNRYYEATRNTKWLVDKGYELILETARFWAEFGHYREVDGHQRFEFFGVTGPNE